MVYQRGSKSADSKGHSSGSSKTPPKASSSAHNEPKDVRIFIFFSFTESCTHLSHPLS